MKETIIAIIICLILFFVISLALSTYIILFTFITPNNQDIKHIVTIGFISLISVYIFIESIKFIINLNQKNK